ncbi:MAG: DNA-directed RNA polymerase subunit alpha [Firmicutes bacterium]|nr:DNA-directed RNA polymerase subunit alpha [Bacillota bacterium]
MMEIERPKIRCEENADSSYAKIVIEPLEKGFGITLGNCLRRVLLSSLPGAAVVGIKLDEVKHEFSTIKGVREDVAEIILNLKGVAVATSSSDSLFLTTVRLTKDKPGIVYAKDIELNSDVTVLNPDAYICTLDKDGKLDIELTIGRGRGYVSADNNVRPLAAPIGYIPMDSVFTPVKKANYEVSPTRVGQSLDYDKLTLEVTTNGTMAAREIVSLAAKIIEQHINLFVDLSDDISRIGILVDKPEPRHLKILEMSIDEMNLSVRSFNCLKRAGINTVDDLTKRSEASMLKVKNLGKKSLDEVIEKIHSYGLKLAENDE